MVYLWLGYQNVVVVLCHVCRVILVLAASGATWCAFNKSGLVPFPLKKCASDSIVSVLIWWPGV
jgi:hypothetical protein